MRTPCIRQLIFFVLILGLFGSCSSSSNPNAINADSVENASSTFNALEGLLFDDSASSKLSTHAATVDPVGKFSMLGCNYIYNREDMFRNINRIRKPLCYIGRVEASSSDFSLGDNDYNYFKVLNTPDDGHVSKDPFLIRLGKFLQDNGKKCLRYQACKDGANQSESFEICETDDGVSASVENSFKDERNPLISGDASLTIDAKADSEEGLASVEIDSAVKGTNGEGSAVFTGDKSTRQNSFVGRFAFSNEDEQSNTYSSDVGVCAYAGAGTGSGKVEGDSQFPAFTPDNINYYCPPADGGFGPATPANQGDSCSMTFSNTESFSYSVVPPSFTIVANADSTWFDQVTNCTIPKKAVVPDPFNENWDCTAPDGFIEIDMASINVDECDAMEDHDRGGNNCDQQRRDFEAANP